MDNREIGWDESHLAEDKEVEDSCEHGSEPSVP
jgi:hypothetical protein